jgi:hypothetical protein
MLAEFASQRMTWMAWHTRIAVHLEQIYSRRTRWGCSKILVGWVVEVLSRLVVSNRIAVEIWSLRDARTTASRTNLGTATCMTSIIHWSLSAIALAQHV